MFGFGDAQQTHSEVYGQDGQPDNQASWTGEALGGAAAFEAMRKYEQHEEENGKPENHQLAKGILAGFAGIEADKLVETKGADFYDREKVKYEAQQNANNYYEQRYMGGEQGGYGGGDGGYDGQQSGRY